MRIHGLCVLKNESDIIEQMLRASAQWCDAIYILDNGSTDGTWEIVRELAHELQSIVLYKQDPQPFTDDMRGEIFRHYEARAALGDWWCILDADEFYIDDPREFLRGVPKDYNAVWHQSYNYLFTDKDLADYKQNPGLYDDHVPIEQRSRYYMVNDYSEMRFFRHSKALKQVSYQIYPVYPRRIRLKHFMYRSPDQIRKRLQTRREPMERGEFLHEKRANWVAGEPALPGPAQPWELPRSWEERVVPASECHFDSHDGVFPEGALWAPPRPPRWHHKLLSRALKVLSRVRVTSNQM